MKTLNDLFQIIAFAVEEQDPNHRTWFFDFSGHVNKMEITYYFTGWGQDTPNEKCRETLTEEGIQSLYWFVKTRLRNKQ